VQTAGVVGSASFLLALTLLIAAPDWLLDVSLRDSFARWVASLNDTMSAMQVYLINHLLPLAVSFPHIP